MAIVKEKSKKVPENHAGWEKIFSKLPVVMQVNKHGYFDITADQIKAISNREPRLMTKIDFREHLPPVMVKAKLGILAISNGVYRIGKFNQFITIPPVSNNAPQKIFFPSEIVTLDPRKLAHESAALDAALLSGILTTVCGEEVALTIRGRTRSPSFSLSLNNVPFPIAGVQIEVDGGYEGAGSVNLIEAKIGSPSNINIRQLIYPQLAWEQSVGSKKTVKTFVCFYQEPVLRFIPIVYKDGFCTVEIAGEQKYILEPEAKLNLSLIKAKPDAILPSLTATFPQADRFDTVLAMLSIVARDKEISKSSLMENFDVPLVSRQIDYYCNVLKWLGLVEIKSGIVKLTSVGGEVAGLSYADKIKRLADIIFSEPIFNHVLKNKDVEVPPQLFKRWRVVKAKTRYRRTQTVEAWIKYFKSLEK